MGTWDFLVAGIMVAGSLVSGGVVGEMDGSGGRHGSARNPVGE